ncbi:MAG: hypothetical protein LBQ76_03010 [Candidatus Fibromonas sp.]|jgi:type IV secretory pathway VirB10-like protein|nr:hypothetical protein [Candidatus Fibromonas sp.]
MEIVLVLLVVALVGFGLSSGSSSGSSSRGGRAKETVVIQPTQPPPPQVIYQQAPPPPPQAAPPPPQSQPPPPPAPESVKKNPEPKPQSAIKTFAVKSYSKIDADNKKGKGEYLSSLVTLMESEGIPKAEALVLIKQALRKANGNAEMFGEQIEKFME